MTTPEIEQHILAFAEDPSNPKLRVRAKTALAAMTDAMDLTALLQQYHLELPVTELVAERLGTVHPDHAAAWELIADTLTSYSDTRERRDRALKITEELNTLHGPDCAKCIDRELLLRHPRPWNDLPGVIELSKRYVALAPRNERAISFHAKALALNRDTAAALEFLDRKRKEAVDDQPLQRLIDSLASEIESSSDILHFWP